jgi:hypothetical protein
VETSVSCDTVSTRNAACTCLIKRPKSRYLHVCLSAPESVVSCCKEERGGGGGGRHSFKQMFIMINICLNALNAYKGMQISYTNLCVCAEPLLLLQATASERRRRKGRRRRRVHSIAAVCRDSRTSVTILGAMRLSQILRTGVKLYSTLELYSKFFEQCVSYLRKCVALLDCSTCIYCRLPVKTAAL